MADKRTILHVDMDAFFASAELTRHPEWRGKPVIVGSGPHERGVVSTCSYEARRFGVHSAMPSRTAYQLCPSAIFTYPDMAFYQELSDKAFEVFSHYSPYIEGVSVDEAFLDITGTIHLFGTAERLGEALRSEVYQSCGVTCSVGIAPNRLLAKIGSEQRKPNGLTLMPFESAAIAAFLAPQPLGVLWGVGKKTAEALRRYGIVTCGDVQRLVGAGAQGLERLTSLLGEAAAQGLAEAAFGKSDNRVYWEEGEEKSVSREHTFDEDEADREVVRSRYLELVEQVGYRFRKETRWARTAKLKIRNADFSTSTRQLPFPAPARDDQAFRAAALALFDREWPENVRRTIRLIGFGVTNFQNVPDAEGPMLFANPEDTAREKRERLSQALDALRARGLM